MVSRRTWLGAGAAAGLAGAATMAYRAAPAFWRQYAREWNRPVLDPPSVPNPRSWPDKGLHAAWLGHSTVLLKINGFTILTDPVFSTRAGIDLRIATLGLKRLVAPALEAPDLPPLDLLLLSHAHMDHLDIPSVRSLESRRTRVITATATSDLLRPGNYGHVRELGWGDTHRVGAASVRAVEVNHWGARMRTDTYRGYNGYLIELDRYRVLFAGDTAIAGTFRGIAGARPLDLIVMPIGAYNPWIRYHCNPEQAWRMAGDARAEFFLPVHHSTFQLGREPAGEPIERLLSAAGRSAGRVALRQIGDEFRLS